jgi:hypothetical protein
LSKTHKYMTLTLKLIGNPYKVEFESEDCEWDITPQGVYVKDGLTSNFYPDTSIIEAKTLTTLYRDGSQVYNVEEE